MSPALPHLLFVWLSPAFPVGAFAYSQGLEMAAERGLLAGHADLEDWLACLITQGSLRNDLIVLAAAHRAAARDDCKALQAANELALAQQPGAERYLETTQQGGSFLIAIGAAWAHAAINRQRAVVQGEGFAGDVAYPVAVGMAAAAHAVPLDATLEAFGFAAISALTSAAIRVSIVSQTGAQRIIAALAPPLLAAARAAHASTLADIGSACFSADLCSLEHETQYSRLFRS